MNIVEHGRLKDVIITTDEGEEKVYHVSLGIGIEVEREKESL